MTRVLVCGGRWYGMARRTDEAGNPLPDEVLAAERRRAEREMARLCHVLDAAVERLGLDHIIEGGALGADRCAMIWAEVQGIPVTTFSAEWKKYGKAAGPIRNKRMLDEGRPDYVIAFPGGDGTADMVTQAKAAGITVHEIKELRDAEGSGA